MIKYLLFMQLKLFKKKSINFRMSLLYLLFIGQISSVNILVYTTIVKVHSFLSASFVHFLD